MYIMDLCRPLAGYNSLLDPHLAGYFSNTRMRRHLHKSGLVSTCTCILIYKLLPHRPTCLYYCSWIIFTLYLSLYSMKEIVPIEEGDYYLTPEGYKCFTAQYHLKRGYCCESNCRHCPYGFNPNK